jgi:hypothetical protein
MGNGIFGRMAANRQARIQNRNNHCQGGRVYYCRQPVVHCQPTAQNYPQEHITSRQAQPIIRHSPVIQSQVQVNVLEQTIPKPPKLDLDFNLIENNTIEQNTNLGQWLKDKRQESEINMFKVGDVHIMEVHGDSPKLQFFDKAGNKWQSLSQKQTLEFYQSKQKFQSQETTNKIMEENNMAGVIGNSPKQSTGLINSNRSDSSAGAGSSSGADASSGSISGAGVLNIIDNSRPVNSNSGPDSYIKQGETEIASKGTIYNIKGNFIVGNRNIGSASGSSTVIGGNAKENGAIGHNAANGGMSKKEKRQLRKLLDRNFDASLKAAALAQEAVDAAKQAAKASKKSSNFSQQSSENSEAAKIATVQTQEALSKLPEQVKNQVRGAIKELNERLEEARTNLKADQSQSNKDQLAEIQKFAKAYLSKVDKLAPDLAERIAPLIKIEVPEAKVELPEINLNLQIEEFEVEPQPVQPQQKAPDEKKNIFVAA